MAKDDTRVPRPFGLTSIMAEYRKTGSEELYIKIRNLVTQGWLLNGGMICGRVTSIQELADFLKCRVGEVHDIMASQMMGSKLWDRSNREAVLDQVIGTAIAWVLDDRMAIDSQVNLLRQSQGDSYKPFISGEVTKAIGLKVSNSNSMQSLIGRFMGGSTINIFNQNNQPNAESTLTMATAIELVQNELKAVDHKAAEYIEFSEELDGLPEVVATKQLGVSTAKEGLSIKKPELIQAMDDYKGATRDAENTHHAMRREIMERIEVDAEDPELEIYK